MANFVYVTGSVTVTSESSKIAGDIVQALDKITSNRKFNTDFMLDAGEEYENEKSFSCDIEATGRWNYITNLENFGLWLKEWAVTNEQINKIKEIEKYEFEMKVTYSGTEEMCSFIEKGEATLIHKANTPFDEVRLIRKDFKTYPYTAENLIKYLDHDPDYAQSQFEEKETA